MIAPIHWYMFVNYLPNYIARTGSFESALQNWKSSLPESAAGEVRAFLVEAAKRDDDCWVLHAQGLVESLDIILDEKKSCKEYYEGMLTLFDQS